MLPPSSDNIPDRPSSAPTSAHGVSIIRRLLSSPRALRLLLLFHVPVFAVAGFWPFNFRQPNLVESVEGRLGLHFGGLGIVYSESPLEPGAGSDIVAQPFSSFTIELLVEPDEEARRNIGPILSLYDGRLPANLMLGQWKSGLVLRTAIRPWEGEDGGYRESGVASALVKGETHLLTVCAGAAGTAFYKDGRLLRLHFGHRPDRGILHGQLVLGSAVSGHAHWKGSLYGAAILDRALTDAEVAERWHAWSTRDRGMLSASPGLLGLYSFDSGAPGVVRDYSGGRRDLRVPDRFVVLRRTAFEFPTQKSIRQPNVSDLVVNVFGFIPFGFFVLTFLRLRFPDRTWRNLALAIVAGALASVIIESVQIFLPTRSSSLLDILANTLGAALGAAVARTLIRESLAPGS